MKYQESRLDNLLLALRYAALGWPVFPAWGVKDGRCLCGGDDCRPGKHPFGRAVPRGHHDATTDPDLLRQWFITPFVNVGVNVGKAKALVLDPDAKHGGVETLARLEAELGPLPHGPLAVTGGGGRHHWLDAFSDITKNFTLPGGIA
ncbi:MAG: bifunctional DNA primase/polymerase, partial [Gemmataceae bacterium]|nr:bifunctional DNA primase/polymerase [Gemmataceae bacterium]